MLWLMWYVTKQQEGGNAYFNIKMTVELRNYTLHLINYYYLSDVYNH